MLSVFITLGVFFFYVSKASFNKLTAFLLLLIYAWFPEILAHSRLITPDMTLACTTFIYLYFLYLLLQKQNWKRTLFTGLSLGLAFISKYTALMLIPISLLLLFVNLIKPKNNIKMKIFSLFVVIITALFVINFSYNFQQSFSLPEFESRTFQRLESNLITNKLLKTTPSLYLKGLDFQLYQSSLDNRRNFFMQQRSSKGIPQYFIGTFLFKTPLPLLILFSANILFIIFISKEKNSLHFLIPVLFFFVYFSFFNNLNIGFRYLLMIYPLLIFSLGEFFDYICKQKKQIFKIILFLLIAWNILETIKIHPHYLAYANQLAGGPQNGYKIWADSSLDWFQDNDAFGRYLDKKQIDIPIDPQHPILGKFAVSVFSMNKENYYEYQWLRDLEKKPVDQYGYTWLIFDITKEDLGKID